MNIFAVVITYEPDLAALNNLASALLPQVDSLLILDNGSAIDVQSFVSQSKYDGINCVRLAENFGIAYAQNVGIRMASDFGASHVLLMDQDSVPAENMVEKLIAALDMATRSSGCMPVAAAGPAYVDSRNEKKSFFVVERNNLPTRWQPMELLSHHVALDVSFLIASGTLIPLNVLHEVGGLRSNYFIDHVDTEWSFRARAKGYRLLGVPDAEMQHTLGDKVENVWFFGNRQVAYHSPLRDYYMFRNTLLMLRDVKLSPVWRFYLLWRLAQFAGYFLTFSANRGERLRLIGLGLFHGIRGKSGRLNVTKSKIEKIPLSPLDPDNS